MPWFVTIPLVVTVGVGVTRLAVEYGGDVIKAVMNFFSKLLGFGKEMSEPMVEQFRDKGEPIRERGKGEKSQERGKEQPQPNRDTNTQQQNRNTQEKQNNRENQIDREQTSDKSKNGQEEQKIKETKKDDGFNPQKEKISDNIKAFIPSNWMNLSQEQKEQAAQSLFNEIANKEKLTQNYQIKFASTNQELGVTDIVDQNNRIIKFDLKHLAEGSQTAIPLYNAIVKEVAYARQHEIMEGMITPNDLEKDCIPAIIFNQKNQNNENEENKLTTKLCIDNDTHKFYFLNETLDKFSANNATSYITAKPTDSFERRAVAALQPSERFATMLQEQYFRKLENEIKDAIKNEKIPISDDVRKQLEDNEKMSFHNIVHRLKSLYGIKGKIENEIENCLLKSNPENQFMKDTPVNWDLFYAIGVYRMQSTMEAINQTFNDPRSDIIQNIFTENHGIIPSMRQDIYNKCKGRLEYENIQVEKIIHKEPVQEKPQPKEEQGNNQLPAVDNNEQSQNKEVPLNEENSVGEEVREEGVNEDIYTYYEDQESDEEQNRDGADFYTSEEDEEIEQG